MQYAHNRGMKFYFFNWNIYVDYASTQYPAITRDQSNPTTIDYMYKSMTALMNTYPELDGFGISAGDGMADGTSSTAKTTWTWNAIGKAVKDYATSNPTRKFNLIHRSIGSGTNEWNSIYAPLDGLGKVTSNYSHKYAQAHMYATPTPKWSESGLQAIHDYGKKSFITVRNDDMFYTNWGDPKFVREFMNGIPNKSSVDGMYIGSDGYTPTASYMYKDNSNNKQLDAERRWYMEMLWGRLAYNPQTSDETFRRMLAKRFSVATSNSLFQAWALASRGIPRATELVSGAWSLDFEWYPEGCNSEPGRCTGFRTIYDFANMSTHPNKEDTTVTNGSTVCDISNSAAGTCSGKKDTYTIANEMQADAENALTLMNSIGSSGNTDFQLAVNNIKQLAYLSLYYAHKIRGATFLKAGQKPKAKDEMAKAYCRWISYTRSMEQDYIPTSFRSMEIMPDWRYADAAVLKDYTDMGGVGIPTCEPVCTITTKVVGCAGSIVEIEGNNSCGGSVTLTAKPAANCNFVSFTDGTTTWTTNPLTVNITVEKQYTANFASTVAPVANFTADVTTITAGTTVNFTDNSTNGPTSWSWSLPGGTPASSNAQNPSVVYSTEGQYDVTLTATNTVGSNAMTKTKHIIVGKAADKVSAITGWVSGDNNPKVSGSSRLMVVMVMGESSGDFAANSVTYGGQAMTKQTDRMYFTNSSRTYASIFTLNEPGVNAATSGTIAVNWNGSASSGSSIYSTILSNVDQATPVTAVANNALTGTTVTIPSEMTAAAGDMIVMCGATASNNSQSFDNGFSKEFESDSGWGDGVGGYKIGTGVTETPSFTQSASGRMVLCAFVAKKMASNTLGNIDFNVSDHDIKTRFYPNPTSGILNIDFSDGECNKEIKVFNALGQLVYNHKTNSASTQIDLKSLHINGSLMVQVLDGKTVSNHKVIVN
jgi:PKD repeat protein